MKHLYSLVARTVKRNQTSLFAFSTSKVQYLDYQATTPVDYRVLDAMMPYFTEHYGNPHSKTHQFGWDSASAIEQARRQVADLIGADEKEIIFTSGATESNNMVLKGLSKFYGDKRKHIITTQIEHKCILDTCRYLELEGFKVTYLPVEKTGLLNVDLLRKTIEDSKEPVLCVSVIFVHNEIGVIQNIQEIGKLCREKGIFLHTDGAQAVGKIDVDVNKLNIDLMSISGHKIYGPKGIGALYLRRKPRVRLAPLINGGGQERGLRSGTLPTPLVVGMGKACEVAKR